jgi:hypothetical protein
MKKILLMVIIALLTVSPAAAEKKSDEDVLREIKEVHWPMAYAEQNTQLLDSILADEFQMIDAAGNYSDKAGELEWVRNNKPTYSSFIFKIKRLEIFDKKTAVIAGTGIVKGAPGPNGPQDFTYESSNVLIKRDGRWQAILSHVSGIKEE